MAALAARDATRETLTPADFRLRSERRGAISASQQSALQEKGIRAPAVTGRSASFSELPGHRVGAIDEDGASRAVQYDGALRQDDERYSYEFDEKQRLVKMTETPRNPGPLTIRRVCYVYDGNDRRIGRRAEVAPLPAVGVMPEETDWRVEDRPDIIASDGLPAEVTYVWDPVTDRLVAVFDAGTGRLLRQMIHGDEAYDDPLEVAVANPSSVTRLYPVFDEAGTGSLQVVVNETGDVVARWGAPGAYGEDEYFIAGPGVQEVSRNAEKHDDGSLESIEITVALTEAIDETTIAEGARLAALDSAGQRIREATATAEPGARPGELRWRLTAAEWTALVAPEGERVPAMVSIAVTNGLRAAAWGDAPVAPAPEWARQLYPVRTTAELPLEYRNSLGEISEWLASIPAGTARSERLYSIEALGGFGSPRDGSTAPGDGFDDPVRLLVLAPFHAHPIQEPLGGHNYVRARVFDPGTGVWLTPDPMGYRDSSNLYAFGGGDPVNGRDPTGTKVKIVGANPDASFEVFKGSLHNPKAAAMLELDKRHGNFVRLKDGFTIEEFRNAAIPQWPYFEENQQEFGIPLSADKRTIEGKYADLITSRRIVEFRAEPGATLKQKTTGLVSLFTDSMDRSAAQEGGGVTLFSDETISGNVEVAVDTDFIKGSGITIGRNYGIDPYDAEITTAHELGHALADVDDVQPCRQSWSVRLENQVRDRKGYHSRLRISEKPINKNPETLACDESKLKEK
jgi:RHS repeat-associated protein